MDVYLAFLKDHWILSSAFITVLLLLIVNEWRHRAFGLKSMSAQELVNIINHANAAVIDVRSADLFNQGHILGAINLPATHFAKELSILNKFKQKPMVLVCATGLEAPKFSKLLLNAGFNQISYLNGGMAAWHSNNMPVSKK